MVGIQTDYEGKGLQLIAINANDASKYPDDSFQNMKKRAREKQFNFPYLRDEDQQVAKIYGAQRTPEVFLFDASRVLRYHGAIDDNYDDPHAVRNSYLRNALDALVEVRDTQTPETAPVGCTIKWK
jgi:peroxiredoxin